MSTTADPSPSPVPLVIRRGLLALEKSLAAYEANVSAYGAHPTPDSPFHTEQEAIRRGSARSREARNHLWQNGLKTAQYINTSTEDHVRGTLVLLRQSQYPLFALTTLSRAACEAAAQVHDLLEPGITLDLRLLRSAASVLRSANEHLRGATLMDFLPDGIRNGIVQKCTRHRDAMLALIDSAGFDVLGGKLHLRGGSEQVVIAPKISALAGRYFPDRPAWYHSFSGTAHSKIWSLSSTPSRITPEGTVTLSPNLLEIGSAIELEIDALGMLDRLCAILAGHNPNPAAARYRQRTKALDMAMVELWESGQLGRLPEPGNSAT